MRSRAWCKPPRNFVFLSGGWELTTKAGPRAPSTLRPCPAKSGFLPAQTGRGRRGRGRALNARAGGGVARPLLVLRRDVAICGAAEGGAGGGGKPE